MKLKPRNANTFEKACRLKTDHHYVSDFCILIDGGDIVLSEQKSGEERKQRIVIPRGKFNRLVDWYLKEQVVHRN